MKRLTLLLAVLLVIGVAVAQDPPAPQPTPQPQPSQQPAPDPAGQDKAKPKKIEAEVVSIDATAKTITVRHNEQEMTHPVQESIVSQLANFSAGDKVMLTVRDEGGQQVVTEIKKSKKADKPAQPQS